MNAEEDSTDVTVTKSDYDKSFKILKDRGCWTFDQIRQLLNPPKGLYDEYVQSAITGLCGNHMTLEQVVETAQKIANIAMQARHK